MIINPVKKVQIALLLVRKIIVPAKYSDFTNVFFEKSINIPLQQPVANEHTIKLKQGKQLSCKPVYSLSPVEFKIFKTYIETNLVNSFIKASKSPVSNFILFICKRNYSHYEFVDY